MLRDHQLSNRQSPWYQCTKDEKPIFSNDSPRPTHTSHDDELPSFDTSVRDIPLGSYDADDIGPGLISVCNAFYDTMKEQDWTKDHQLGTKYWHDKVYCSFNDQDFQSGRDTSYTEQLQIHSELSDSEVFETKADVRESSGYATVFQWVRVGLGPHKMQMMLLNVIKRREFRGEWRVYRVDSIKAENMF